MGSAGIPSDVEQFVASTIRSVEQLEVLLLLHDEPQRDWRAREVSSTLRTQEASAAAWLAALAEAGLAKASGDGFRYEPPARLHATIDELQRCYATYRVRLIGLIFAGPDDSIQSFADAFRLRRKS